MNLTDLHYVVEIDKSGSISKAAKELYVAQPNLSKAIKHLEREFGISIFERSSKGVKATREGQKFLEYAKRIIYEIEEMKRDCSDLGKSSVWSTPYCTYVSSDHKRNGHRIYRKCADRMQIIICTCRFRN